MSRYLEETRPEPSILPRDAKVVLLLLLFVVVCCLCCLCLHGVSVVVCGLTLLDSQPPTLDTAQHTRQQQQHTNLKNSADGSPRLKGQGHGSSIDADGAAVLVLSFSSVALQFARLSVLVCCHLFVLFFALFFLSSMWQNKLTCFGCFWESSSCCVHCVLLLLDIATTNKNKQRQPHSRERAE
jgi:predicted PurR-regulated permease PerM